ncbi:MAG: asparagine synthase-related protein [bacterium]
MFAVNLDRIASTFFACGCIREPTPPELREKIHALGDRARIFPLEGYGYFFFTTPAYADVAENDEMVCIKLGHVHDGERLLSTEDIICRGHVAPDGVRVGAIQGSGTLIAFAKHEPRCFIYRDLLSAPMLNYWTEDEDFIATDNLRVMISLMPDPQLDEDILPQHFMHRRPICDNQTYIRGVSQLLVGEVLTWNRGSMKINLERDFRRVSERVTRKPVNTETVAWFFKRLSSVVGLYLKDNAHNSATMLSGGVDSSLLQAAINTQPYIDFPFPAFSFAVETPSFAYETEYARGAARALGTDHTFVKISAEEYADRLVQCTEILGRPVQDDVRACQLALADYISCDKRDIRSLFDGTSADGLHGLPESLGIIQGDKYRSWPIPVLKFLGSILAPVSQSKSYGAVRAAEVLLASRDIDSPDHYLNSIAMYTDWGVLCRSFPRSAIHEALASKRDLEMRYLGSDIMVEKAHVISSTALSSDTCDVVRQLGLFYGRELIFPYGDVTIVKATFSFDPLDRYTFDHRVKPILKLALESQVSLGVTSGPKGWSGVGEDDLMNWMRDGVLRDLVQDIDRPPFVERADFERKLEQPDWFTWNLLTLDLFKKHVLMRG